jgi:hypothetical protein
VKTTIRARVHAVVRLWLRCRHAVWRWRFKRLIAKTRGWNPGVRAICLAAATWESVAFVHDALFHESNAKLRHSPSEDEVGSSRLLEPWRIER